MGKRNKKSRKERNKVNYKVIISFFVFMMFFTALTAPFMIMYGPFEEAKKTFVGTAMNSMNYQWLATTFLSDEKINNILGTNQNTEVEDDEDMDKNLVSLPKDRDDSIEAFTLTDNSKFTGHVLVVKDPTRVKVGTTSQLFKEGESTSQIAQNYGAVAAINGGAFTDEEGTQLWTSNGGIPVGILMSEGKVLNDGDNGLKSDVTAITEEGRLLVGNFTMAELKQEKVTDALAFSPGVNPVLIKNGKMSKISGDGGLGTAPRTLIGQRKDGSIVLVVLDSNIPGGRVCATYKEAQEVMYKLDCVTAMLLDGGKSSTMYYDGEVINNPSNSLGERPIASAFIVK